MFFCLYIEINNKRAFWPSATEVVLFFVVQILNIVKTELQCGSTAT